MHTALPVLYSFRRCPYAIRARLALVRAGVTVVVREVDLKHKPPELLACSPAATVPVLDLGKGGVLAHSLDIMRWALAQHDPEGWLIRADEPVNAALVDTNDTAFKAALDRYKYAERHPERSRSAYREDAQDSLLTALEAALQKAPFLGGAHPCLSDAALFPFVRQFAGVEPGWWAQAGGHATRRWLDHWQGSPLFAAAMVKMPVWQPDAQPLRFPV
ncbi:MAG: glutathione S-transferase [Hydrogenophaga sp.]|jgi:glutathione S-transferase|nr:glutathione S-transferase [Hydrogenophaga sp.]